MSTIKFTPPTGCAAGRGHLLDLVTRDPCRDETLALNEAAIQHVPAFGARDVGQLTGCHWIKDVHGPCPAVGAPFGKGFRKLLELSTP